MSTLKHRVCIIGAGPNGMSALFHFGQLDTAHAPEVVCFEKQETWGGLWNFDWRTGTDRHGEPFHGSMYKHLWANAPKENFELPDYTFDEHFGKATASYAPRAVLRDYLEGRWTRKSRVDLKNFVRFNTVVRFVRFNHETGQFTVTVQDLENDVTIDECFSHVIVAVGIFNVPNLPEIEGIDTFKGRILHSKDFKDAKEFKGQRILAVGSSYSAEDVALQSYKYGAKHVICTWRTKPIGHIWPNEIEERPLVQKVEGNKAFFKDGSVSEIDTIILCTGYKYHFPFMEDNLRLKSGVSFYPDGLYKGTVWLNGGNNRLFYSGVQLQWYTFTMFDVVGLWIRNYILGDIVDEPKAMSDMLRYTKDWVQMAKEDEVDCLPFQTSFVANLGKDVNFNDGILKFTELIYTWKKHRAENILTYRDRCYASFFTGTMALKRTPWMQSFDETLENFVNETM